jgi:acyl-coenzyme A synthetase/AMP-(fatty) acid ligase
LKGIGVVLFHRATQAEALAHVLKLAPTLTVLVLSRHLRHILIAAQKILSDNADAVRMVRHVIFIDDHIDAHAQVTTATEGGQDLPECWREHSWNEALELGRSFDAASIGTPSTKVVKPDSIVKLLPSSGSTGLPKLIVVTEEMLRTKVLAAARAKRPLAGVVVVYAYEAIRQSHDVLLSGGRIGFFSGSLERMLEDCQV